MRIPWASGRFGAEAFVLQENGTLRCPAGSSLWLSEVRQENAFTQRAIYLGFRSDCEPCALKEQCLGRGAKGNRARRVSAVCRLLPPPATVSRKPVPLGPIRWVDAGRVGQVEPFAALGPPIGAVNTPRSSCLSRLLRGVSLHHVPLVQYVRITAGVGRTDSHRMPGGDHRNCVLPEPSSPPFSPLSNTGGTGSQRDGLKEASSSL